MQPIYILPLLVSTAASLFLAGAISRFRHAPGALPLLILILSAGEWAAGYALELSSPTLEAKMFWAQAQYFGIIAIPICWFYFSTTYLGAPAWLSRLRFRRFLVMIIPTITLFLVVTNHLHGLIWNEIDLHTIGQVQFLELEYGPWFWANWVYSYCLLVGGSIWLSSRLFVSKSRLKRWQIGTALAGILIPWLGNFIYVTQLNPIRDYDWTPVLFTFSGLLLAISLFRFHLIAVIPAAHKNVVDDLADGVIVLEPNGNVIYLNPAARRILNLPDQEILGLPISAALPEKVGPFEAMPVGQEYQGALQLGESSSPCYFTIQSTPLTDANRTVVARLVVLHDITQQKLEQDQLQKSHDELEGRVRERTEELLQANEQLKAELDRRNLAEKRFQEIVSSSMDGILLVAPDGSIVLANSQVESLFGYSMGELYNQCFDVLLPEKTRRHHREYLAQFFTNPARRQMGEHIDIYAVNKEGREFPVEINLSSLKMADGILAACTIRDISKRQQSEKALRESESLYRALFENANDAILLIDVNGNILQVNQKTANLLGYSQEELAKMNVQNLIAPQDYLESQNKRQALLDGQNVPIFERYIHIKNGQVFPVDINLSLVNDPQGQPKFIQAIVRDISERKDVEEKQRMLLQEVRQSREQLRHLATRLAEVQDIDRRQIATELHDRIGQNLTGLNLNLQIIQNNLDKESDPKIISRLEDSLTLLEETTRHVRNVMADLNPPMLDEFGLISTLHWYCNKFSERTGLKISVAADELKQRFPQRVEMTLFRIMQEILNNIAKHAQATEVSIDFQQIGENINISVQDNGKGFDPKAIQNSEDQSHWGLIAAKERAASIGGKLIIHSAHGNGTCVFVLFRRDANDG